MTTVVELTNVEGEGAVAIPSKTLLETLKLIPETPIVFEIDMDNLSSEIYCSKRRI